MEALGRENILHHILMWLLKQMIIALYSAYSETELVITGKIMAGILMMLA
jgi:hypothetical protein